MYTSVMSLAGDSSHTLMTDVTSGSSSVVEQTSPKRTKIRTSIRPSQKPISSIEYEVQKAIDRGLSVLRNAGYVFPANASQFSVMFELVKTKRMLRKLSDQDILNLPLMTDEEKLSAMRIMTTVIHGSPMYTPLIAMRLVQMTLKFGSSGMSAVGLSAFAMLLCNDFGDVELGIRLGRLSVTMLDKFENKEWLPRVFSACYGMCFTLQDPLRDSLKPLLMSHRVGLVGGDIEFSMLSAVMYAGVGLSASLPLAQLVDKCSSFLRIMKQHNQTNMAQFLAPTLQLAKCFMGADCENPCVLDGDIMNGIQAMKDAVAANNAPLIAYLHWINLVLASSNGDYEAAMNHAAKLSDRSCDTTSLGCYHRAAWYVQEALAAFSLPSVSDRRTMKIAMQNLKQLKSLASYSKHNFTSHVLLVEAEMAVTSYQFALAVAKYNDAHVRALDEQQWQQAGLVCERAARALARKGQETDANTFLEKAIDAYEQWGADVKVASLKSQMIPEGPFEHLEFQDDNHSVTSTLSNVSERLANVGDMMMMEE